MPTSLSCVAGPCTTMDLTKVSLSELRKCIAPAVDLLVTLQVVDDSTITAQSESLEQRVLNVLRETDESQMPPEWSWEKAARNLSVLIALDMHCVPFNRAVALSWIDALES